MKIRPSRPEEIPILKRIMVEAFEGVCIDQGMENLFGSIHGQDWRWRKARHLDWDLAKDPQGAFVLEIDGQIAGFITTWQDREAGIGHIPNLALAPQFRGQGYGRKLIQYALDHFRRNGLTHAKIETLVQNAVGRHLYKSCGFREVAWQIHFVADLSEPAPSGSPDQGAADAPASGPASPSG
ncbi:MAG TPA: GNAT family N-acetyltransferase [Planctomycetaceae bacterium]|nr:GNAT family N-acetyltransferase [Planctomycetaceae bacterium]